MAQSSSYTDVPAGSRYADAVAYVTAAGLMKGVTEDTFVPDAELANGDMAAVIAGLGSSGFVNMSGAPVTREALVKLLFATAVDHGMVAVTMEENLQRFGDRDQISRDIVHMMNWAVGRGIIDGRAWNMLEPAAPVTRGECAVMLQRFCERCL